MVDVVLFELEGIVFETRELRRASLRDALATHGIDAAVDADLLDALSPRAATIAALSTSHMSHDVVLIDLIALSAERNFSAGIATSGAALCDGARTFIEGAAADGRLGVVTRMARGDVQLMLRLADLENATTVVVCADDIIDGKPSPEGHRMALSRMWRQRGAEPSRVIALEDGAAGIRAARAAGIRCVAVGPLPTHIAIDADAYVASIDGQTLRSLDTLSMPGRERVQ